MECLHLGLSLSETLVLSEPISPLVLSVEDKYTKAISTTNVSKPLYVTAIFENHPIHESIFNIFTQDPGASQLITFNSKQ